MYIIHWSEIFSRQVVQQERVELERVLERVDANGKISSVPYFFPRTMSRDFDSPFWHVNTINRARVRCTVHGTYLKFCNVYLYMYVFKYSLKCCVLLGKYSCTYVRMYKLDITVNLTCAYVRTYNSIVQLCSGYGLCTICMETISIRIQGDP